jgi:hypothetical protein
MNPPRTNFFMKPFNDEKFLTAVRDALGQTQDQG